jgi:hypothetical protein
MSLMELKMQPTIQLGSKAGYLPRPYPALRSKCIVGCIFNSVGLVNHLVYFSFKFDTVIRQ